MFVWSERLQSGDGEVDLSNYYMPEVCHDPAMQVSTRKQPHERIGLMGLYVYVCLVCTLAIQCVGVCGSRLK